MLTYQDYEKAKDKIKWIAGAVATYRSSVPYKLALEADEYDAQRNPTINEFVRKVYDITGASAVDTTAANNRIAGNFFHRLNTDRCHYLLGNGVSFPVNEGEKDDTKEKLGNTFDTALTNAVYYALIHGDSYIFPNGENVYNVFPKTQFLPLFDEDTGKLRGGIRFWSLDWNRRPIQVVLYEEDGYTKYATAPGKYGLGALVEVQKKRAYVQQVRISEADGEEIVGESNYGVLPIVPVYANKTRQSSLVGMKANIDAYDMILSGFANDLQDCAQVYWIVNNAMGMDSKDVDKLRDRLIFQHIAVADTDNSSITPYTQEIPHNARVAALQQIRNSIYEDFGGLDVHTIAAGATNDHIDAAYNPVDEEADALEYEVIQVVQQIERIKGMEPKVPQFKRNKISNQKEQTEMVMLAAQYLDDETLLTKLPFVTVDETAKILMAKDLENGDRFEDETEE